MTKEFEKKIEIKNLADIVSENLRILNSKKNESSKTNKKFIEATKKTVDKHTNQFNEKQRIPISSEEGNVNILETSKDIERGKSYLKGARKILHREIQDWVVQPFQIKQTRFNQKALRNIKEIYSEINVQNKKIHKAKKKIERSDVELTEKIESNISELTKRIDRSNEELTEKIEDSTEIIENIKHRNSELTKKINEFKEKKIQEIKEQKKLFENKKKIK